MKAIRSAALGAVIVATAMAAAAPAFALGACGRNAHRDAYGHCVFGGQNQAYCLRRTGHTATYVGGGVYRCFR